MNKQTNIYLFILAMTFLAMTKATAQNPKIKCYFNHPVNTALSSGVVADDVKGNLPKTVVSYINNAKYSLDFAMYQYNSKAKDVVSVIAAAINNAHKRGVKVRWICNGTSNNAGLTLLDTSIHTLASPLEGVNGYGKMHDKFFIVDANSPDSNDAYVVTGSYNYTVEQTGDYNNLLVLQNQPLAQAYYAQFNQMWGGTDSVPNLAKSVFGTHKKTSPLHYFNVNGTRVDVHFSPKDSTGVYFTNAIKSANSDLTFGIYSFHDNNIANEILKKYKANVIVRGIEDSSSQSFAPNTTLSGPLGNNFVVYSGNSTSALYHNKVLIVDALKPSSDPQVAAGSFNWETSAENLNDENSIIVHDSFIANEYYQSLCNDITVNGGSPCVSPLPLDWVSFNASLTINNTVALNWAIADQLNINHFEVERSVDAAHFAILVGGIVPDTKNDNYQLIDGSPNKGANYYRIKEVDNDGTSTFSKVISVEIVDSRHEIVVVPNPTRDVAILKGNKIASIQVIDNIGRAVKFISLKDATNPTLSVSSLPSGVYHLRVTTTDGNVIGVGMVKE